MKNVNHILMTADTIGGVWTYSVELARGLATRGVRVTLATMGAPLSAQQRDQAHSAGLDVYASEHKLEWMEQPWRDVDAAGEWLLKLEAELRPDLIHLNNYAHGDLPWRAPVVIVGHSCVLSWWKAVHGKEAPESWTEYHRRVRKGLLGAQAVVGVSRAMLRELQHWYDIPFGSVIYNGHQTEMYEPSEKEDVVLSTGRVWDAAKNMAVLDQAAALTKYPVYVAGDIQHPEGGQRGLQNAVSLGVVPPQQLRPRFASAAVYAAPALYEPFGLSVLEAALSGCALVLGDIPSLREIWGEAALYVPPRDHEALALAINALMARRSKRDDLAKKARARALTFTLDRMVESYLGVYSEARAQFRANTEASTACVS